MPAAPTGAALQAFLAPSIFVYRKVDIYESDGVTPWMTSVPFIEGQVSVDQTRDERRTMSLVVSNEDGSLTPSPDGGLWYDKIVKFYRGLHYTETDGTEETYSVQVGEFMIDSIESPRFPSKIQLQGLDYTKKLLLDKFAFPTAFETGEFIIDVISAIALNGGISRMSLPSTSQVLTVDMVFDRGDSRWEAIKEIAEVFGWEIYFDNTGYLTMREFRDPITSPIVHTFKTGEGGTLANWSKRSEDSRIANHVAVVGESTNETPVYGEAENTLSTSPTSIARLGRRTYEYSSSLITTEQQAIDLAEDFLSVMALESFDVKMDSTVLPWLGVGEIIRFEDPDPYPNDPVNFLLSSIEIPFGLGPMSCVGKRITIVG